MDYSLTGIHFAGLTDVGLHRSANQDSYYLSPQGDLFIVADGMGGHIGGQEASRIATEVIREYLMQHRASDDSPDILLEQDILKAHEAVIADQRQHKARADMGTTVDVAMVQDSELWYAHVGDYRL